MRRQLQQCGAHAHRHLAGVVAPPPRLPALSGLTDQRTRTSRSSSSRWQAATMSSPKAVSTCMHGWQICRGEEELLEPGGTADAAVGAALRLLSSCSTQPALWLSIPAKHASRLLPKGRTRPRAALPLPHAPGRAAPGHALAAGRPAAAPTPARTAGCVRRRTAPAPALHLAVERRWRLRV